MNFEDYLIKCLIEPYEKMLFDGMYHFSILDGWMLYDKLYRVIKLTEAQRNEYKEQARAITLRGDGKKETDEAYEKRVIKNAKHLAFKEWIQEKALEEFNLREFILMKIKNNEVHYS